MKKLFLLGAMVCALGMMTACTRGKYTAADVSVERFMSHEWISFHVDKYWVEGKNKELSSIGYEIVIHNVDDSTQVIANLCSDGECNLLTPQWAKYVCSRDFDVAFYRNMPDGLESQWYDEITCNVLQCGIDFFPMYYPTYNEWCMVTLPEKSSNYKLMADGSLRVKATVTQKHCYADHCEMVDDPLTLYFDCELGMFVAGENIEHGSGPRYEISNVRFDSRQAMLDSIFNLDAPWYAHYDRFEGEQFIQSRIVTRNTDMNDTVLDYPIVNVRTGDTVTLRQIQGTTLLQYAYLGRNISRDDFLAPDAYAPQIQNIIMVFPNSNNAELMRSLADSLGLADNVYYVKGLTRELSINVNRAILIGPDHKTIAACPAGTDFAKWIRETLKGEEMSLF